MANTNPKNFSLKGVVKRKKMNNDFTENLEKHTNNVDMYVLNKKIFFKNSFRARIKAYIEKNRFLIFLATIGFPILVLSLFAITLPANALSAIIITSFFPVWAFFLFFLLVGSDEFHQNTSLDKENKKLYALSIMDFIDKNQNKITKKDIKLLEACIYMLDSGHDIHKEIPLVWWNDLLSILFPVKRNTSESTDVCKDIKNKIKTIYERAHEREKTQQSIQITNKINASKNIYIDRDVI